MTWSPLQLSSKQWIITQQFTARAIYYMYLFQPFHAGIIMYTYFRMFSRYDKNLYRDNQGQIQSLGKGSVGLLEPPFWQELLHFHGNFGQYLEISRFCLENCPKWIPLSKILHPALWVVQLCQYYIMYTAKLREKTWKKNHSWHFWIVYSTDYSVTQSICDWITTIMHLSMFSPRWGVAGLP